MKDVIKTFGIWQVSEDGIDCLDTTHGADCNLSVSEIFQIDARDGLPVWVFPLRMAQQEWMFGSAINCLREFNDAFKFAQKHFKDQRPAHTFGVPDDHTWDLQRQRLAMQGQYLNQTM